MRWNEVAWLLFLGTSQAADILGFLPFYGTSHSKVTIPFFEELARRGHNVTVAGYFEPKNPPPNYRTILFKPLPGTQLRGFLSVEDYRDSHFMTTMYLINRVNNDYFELIRRNSFDRIFDGKYDLVILEYFESELFAAYVSRFGVPFIFLHTCEPFPWHRDTLADPFSPSIIPEVFSARTIEMNFSERFRNTIELFAMMYYYSKTVAPSSQRMAEHYLGPLPSVRELAKNASLYLINTHTSLYGSRPANPSTIEIGGVHVFPPNPLPEDLQTLMDNAKNGVIFFSMGSVLKGSSMKEDKRDAILRVFSELDETVLWKWEGEIANKPPNLHTSPWYPQRDLFAHPNLKLFIGHCGLLGIHEAITEGLPIICLPMFGDQPFNAAAIQRQGFGLSLEYASFNEELFRKTINRVLKEPSFKENAKRVSAAFTDRPMSAMDTAVYWTEYVMRHKGAPHLKSPARYMAWWEYHNVDVLATIAAIVLFVLILMYKMIKSFLTLLFCRKSYVKVKTS